MRIRNWLLMSTLCAGLGTAAQSPSQDGTRERSSTLNNDANRASDPTAGEAERFRQVPGGTATPRKDWRKGDRRGKPQKLRVSRKHVEKKLREQRGAGK